MKKLFESVTTIAEVGLAHEGSLGMAHSYIDAAAECGVTAVKFQTHIADQESSSREQFRVKVFPQDETRYDYWQRTAFGLEQWRDLASHCQQVGVRFLSSPFSNRAVDWLEDCGVAAWKVASGEISNLPMLTLMCETGKPILLSSGMSSWRELDQAVELISKHGNPLVVFQCTTAYPCPPEKWGLNVLGELRTRYRCPVGLSDHSGDLTASIAAVALGATFLEFHVVYSKRQFGPDSKASLTFSQTKELVSATDDLWRASQVSIDKDQIAEQFKDTRVLFSKSIVSARAMKAGSIVQATDLAYKKPGDGIPASRFESIIGKRLIADVNQDHYFSDQDFE